MNLGQMFFAIGALNLLSFIILRVNSNIIFSDVVLQNSKDGILANSVAAGYRRVQNCFLEGIRIADTVRNNKD